MINAGAMASLVRFSGELGRPGAAFQVLHEGHRYLVTAKHLCLDDEAGEQITIRNMIWNDAKPHTFVAERVGPLSDPADVAVFRLTGTVLALPSSLGFPPLAGSWFHT